MALVTFYENKFMKSVY